VQQPGLPRNAGISPIRSALAVARLHGLNPRPRMYLLKKVFQLREQVHADHEKPFLEHLEDLRVMITRIVMTLIISMIICFTFQEQLMDVLRRPVDRVLTSQAQARLPQTTEDAPRPLSADLWDQAKTLERAAAGLPPAEREAVFASLDNPDLQFHAKAASLLRAALALPEDRRITFIDSLDTSDEMKQQVRALLITEPGTEIEGRGDLRMMSALRPTETFMLSMKLSFFAGIILSFPLLLMFILQFVLPGLHSNEKRVLWPSMLIGFGLFLAGVSFAYFAVLPRALGFFYEWSGKLGVSNDWRIGEYIGFATQFTLLFGLSFELPVVVMVFVKLGMLTYETMSKTRAYAVIAILVIAAILTPTPDIFTLVLMALPMIFLYEVCIWLAFLDHRKSLREEEQEERERRERMERLLLDREPEPAYAGHYHDDHPDHHAPSDHDSHGHPPYHEPGDDGWHEEYPQHDPHHDEPPRFEEDYGSPLDPPPDSIPEAEERRRSSDGKFTDES
jgi:sec-independent protein translocase protein TatC